MNSEQRIQQLAEGALNSLDGITRAEPRSFFYTRLSGRRQQAPAGIWEQAARFLARPVVAIACVLVVLLGNMALLLNNKNGGEPAELVADDFTTAGMNTTTAVLFDAENINTEP